MSSLNSNNSFTKRKPVPIASEEDYGDFSQTSRTNGPTDLSFLNQIPRAPVKSPLRQSGNQNSPTTPISSSSTQTTILQPVMSTMTITSAPTVTTQTVSNSSPISKSTSLRSRPSIVTSINSERELPTPRSHNNKEYEESIKSNQTYNSKRRGSEQSVQTTSSPTSIGFPSILDINSTNIASSPPKVKLSSLAIANDLIASSEAILSLNTPKFPGSSFLDTADEMLMQILISQAVIDSKDFEILSLEEVEELKKDHSLLTTRIAALTSKLSLESKIREAASSLARLHASNKRLSKQATDHLATANRKVDQVATELWKLTQRAGEVQRKLLQHMAGILSLGIRKLEEKNSQHSPQNLPQPQVMDGIDNKIDNLFNEIMGVNNNAENGVTNSALLEKVSNLEHSLQNVHQTLAEARMSIKRKDKEIEELKAKVDDTAAEARERTVAELRTELEEIGSRLDIVLRKHKASNRENNIGSGSDNEDPDETFSGTSSFYRLSTLTTATQHLQKEQYKNIEENLSALEKALENYMFKIYKMEQEINSAKNKSDDEIKTLQNQLQEATEDLNQSQEALKTEKIKNSDAGNEINELKEKVKRVQDLEEQIKDMEQRQSEKGIDEKNFNVDLELKLKQTTREYEEMMGHLKQLFNILPSEPKDDSQNGYNDSNKNKFGVDEFINRVRAVGEENRRLNDQTSLLQSRLERIHEQMMELKGKDNIKQELKDTRQELEETKAKLSDLEDKAQSAKSQVQSTNEKENEMRNELESLRQQLMTSKEKIRKFEAIMKRQSVLQVVNDGTSIKEEFQQQLAAQEQEYEAQLKERDIFISKLRTDLTDTVTEKDNVSQTVRDLEEMLKSKSRNLDQREVTINRLEGDIVKYKSELAELKAVTDGESRFNRNSNGINLGSGGSDPNKLKEELEAIHEELKHLRNVKEKLEAQLKQANDTLEKAQAAFSEREEALEKRSETMQAELDGILKEFDRLTRTFIDFDSERQKLENSLDNVQKKCEKLENELADEKLKNIGMDSGNEPASTATLRKEFRKMMADLRSEQQKLLHRETEEKKKLENNVRNLKREREAEKWERANKGTQTGFVVSVLSG